jgi:hypothetical protein
VTVNSSLGEILLATRMGIILPPLSLKKIIGKSLCDGSQTEFRSNSVRKTRRIADSKKNHRISGHFTCTRNPCVLAESDST